MSNARRIKNVRMLACHNIRATILLALLYRLTPHCVSCHGAAAHFYIKHKAEIEQRHILSSSIFSGTAKYGFGLQSAGINSGLPIFGILSAKINMMESIDVHKTTNINFGINYIFDLSMKVIKNYIWSTLSNNNQEYSYLNHVAMFLGIKAQISKSTSIYCDIRYPLINLVSDDHKIFDTTFDASATLKYGKQHFNAYLMYRISYNKTHDKKTQCYHAILFGIKIFKKHKSVYANKKQGYFMVNITNRSNAHIFAEFNLHPHKDDTQQNIIDEIVPQAIDKCIDTIFKKYDTGKMLPQFIDKCVDAIYKHEKYGANIRVSEELFKKASKLLLVNPKKIIREYNKNLQNTHPTQQLDAPNSI